MLPTPHEYTRHPPPLHPAHRDGLRARPDGRRAARRRRLSRAARRLVVLPGGRRRAVAGRPAARAREPRRLVGAGAPAAGHACVVMVGGGAGLVGDRDPLRRALPDRPRAPAAALCAAPARRLRHHHALERRAQRARVVAARLHRGGGGELVRRSAPQGRHPHRHAARLGRGHGQWCGQRRARRRMARLWPHRPRPALFAAQPDHARERGPAQGGVGVPHGRRARPRG